LLNFYSLRERRIIFETKDAASKDKILHQKQKQKQEQMKKKRKKKKNTFN
jgi:hypothetical protein